MWGKGKTEEKKKYRKQWNIKPKHTDVKKALDDLFEDEKMDID